MSNHRGFGKLGGRGFGQGRGQYQYGNQSGAQFQGNRQPQRGQ